MNDEARKKILAVLDDHRIMAIATLRPDGWPQTTTVSYVNEGLILYFLCGVHSQKAANLARNDRVSVAIADDTPDPMAALGLSMAAHAQAVTETAKADEILCLLLLRYPDLPSFPVPMSHLRVFRVTPPDRHLCGVRCWACGPS